MLVGWTVAQSAPLTRRDRGLVTLAGVLPDIDGLGFIAESMSWDWETPLYWYSEYHHRLAHNLSMGLFAVLVAAAVARRRLLTALLVFVAFHLHLLGDLVGSRGPLGYPWPIPYLAPFSERLTLVWEGQWALNAWPNILLSLLLLAFTFWWAWSRGRSPLEFVSLRLDGGFVATLRRRFGAPRTSSGTA